MHKRFFSSPYRTDFCVWWHKQHQHWWLGQCKDVGKNPSNAYLNPGKICPYEEKFNKTIVGYISYSGKFQYALQSCSEKCYQKSLQKCKKIFETI